MATRRLDGVGWADALSRLDLWRSGDLAVCWALVRAKPDKPWAMIGITVRGGINVPQRDYEYANLKLQSRMMAGPPIASALRSGHLAGLPVEREFRELHADEGIAEWLTSGAIYGMTGPMPTPSYYYSQHLTAQEIVTMGRLSEPVYGPGQLYYPSGNDALWEVLYGMTRHQGRRDLSYHGVIHLPYADAY